MKGEPSSEDRITKARRFPQKTTKKLEYSKKVNGNSKKSYEETVQQKEKKFTRIERRQHVVRSKKYPFKLTLKEAEPEIFKITKNISQELF